MKAVSRVELDVINLYGPDWMTLTITSFTYNWGTVFDSATTFLAPGTFSPLSVNGGGWFTVTSDPSGYFAIDTLRVSYNPVPGTLILFGSGFLTFWGFMKVRGKAYNYFSISR
jgi:hypothetical protein